MQPRLRPTLETARSRRPRRLFLLLFAAAVGTASLVPLACAGESSKADSTAGEDAATVVSPAMPNTQGARDRDTGADTGAGGAPGVADELATTTGGATSESRTSSDGVDVVAPPTEGRKVISTGSLRSVVDDPVPAVTEATALVEALGGYLAAEESGLGTLASSTVTFRVPPDKFATAMERLGRIGKLRERRISSDDVTEAFTDLEGRVKTLTTSIGRLQGFLDKATDVNQIAALEAELTRREIDLESIQGQLRVMQARVDFATVVATFETKSGSTIAPDEDTGFMDALRNGWKAFTKVVNALVVAFATALPFVVLGVVVVLLGRWSWRRRKRSAPPASPTAAPAPIPTAVPTAAPTPPPGPAPDRGA